MVIKDFSIRQFISNLDTSFHVYKSCYYPLTDEKLY